MNISITGNLGSGKSSICKCLREEGYEIISAGTLFRELAVMHGMSVEAFNQKVNQDIANGDHSIDDRIDQRTAQLDAQADHLVFDSRLAFHFAPRSFKTFIMVDPVEAAKRVYYDTKRAESEKYNSLEECYEALQHRQEMELCRFRELYGVDFFSWSNYNLIIESTYASPNAVAQQLLTSFTEFQRQPFHGIYLNPASIHVSETVQPSLPGERNQHSEDEQTASILVTRQANQWIAIGGQDLLKKAKRDQQDFVRVLVEHK
ncbi:MAG: dephospho-CoA kinase [Lachnospiraceae bacterium]|nr:dephospho-CoA kinase [Lachnospiraceae bacterium]